MKVFNITSVEETLKIDDQEYTYFDLNHYPSVKHLPFSIKILLEGALRKRDDKFVTLEHIERLLNWESNQRTSLEIPFLPARVIFQDYTGVPAVVDLAAMRDKLKKNGQDSTIINPQIPVDLVIDHSLIVEKSGFAGSIDYNVEIEYERNAERYRFVRWAQQAFQNFNVVPPSSGIVHQVNLESLSTGVVQSEVNHQKYLYPDSLVGTDSHTPMINGLGVLGWGVGGIEAESVMLGQPLYLPIPEVVGVKLTGALKEGVTATDLALSITELLRKLGVVGKFVEFFGAGLSNLTLADRATISNMAPEYGSTISFFPFDEEAVKYLQQTGRTREAHFSEMYYKTQGLFRNDTTEDPVFSQTVVLNLNEIEPSLAGPKRPQDRVPLSNMKDKFIELLSAPIKEGGYELNPIEVNKTSEIKNGNKLCNGDVVLAAITSCTNTSNPSVMIAAGLVAKKAVELGMRPPSYVKTTLTPGSMIVETYLKELGLLQSLEEIGFYIDGFGCAACCGNSGPLQSVVEDSIKSQQLIVSSVLSGNRNFEGRVHPLIKANYLASPPLVVIYALAGTIIKDFSVEPIGMSADGKAIFLKDLWPHSSEINEMLNQMTKPKMYTDQYSQVYENDKWNSINSPTGMEYEWDMNSTYIQKPPFLDQISNPSVSSFEHMRPLLILGDSITTDHISPAGRIQPDGPAGKYLLAKGVSLEKFNSYGARRGNHEVMMRGTFANIRIRNKMLDGMEGGFTKYIPTGEVMSVFDAAMKYEEQKVNLLIIAGKEYGTGSSRDWAAKGTKLLGVKAVLAESFERIHRSNLIGIGVLPLQFIANENLEMYNLNGEELYDIELDINSLTPKMQSTVLVTRLDGTQIRVPTIVRLDNIVEIETYANGGIFQTVLKKILT